MSLAYEREQGQWFATPNGEGSDVGPFSSEEEALEWICGDQMEDENDFEFALRIAKTLGWIEERQEDDLLTARSRLS